MIKKRIVIAEDEIAYGIILQDALEKRGYAVTVVKNGEELLKHLHKEEASLILLDLLMPVVDGFEALVKIKEDDTLKHIKVIALSNLSQDEEIERAKKLGADAFIVKSNETFYSVLHKIDKMMEQVA